MSLQVCELSDPPTAVPPLATPDLKASYLSLQAGVERMLESSPLGAAVRTTVLPRLFRPALQTRLAEVLLTARGPVRLAKRLGAHHTRQVRFNIVDKILFVPAVGSLVAVERFCRVSSSYGRRQTGSYATKKVIHHDTILFFLSLLLTRQERLESKVKRHVAIKSNDHYLVPTILNFIALQE